MNVLLVNLKMDNTPSPCHQKTQVHPKHNRLKRAKAHNRSGSFSERINIIPRHLIDITEHSFSCDGVIKVNNNGKLPADTVMINNDEDNSAADPTSPDLPNEKSKMKGQHENEGSVDSSHMDSELSMHGTQKRNQLTLKKMRNASVQFNSVTPKEEQDVGDRSPKLDVFNHLRADTVVVSGRINTGNKKHHHTPGPLIQTQRASKVSTNVMKTHREMRSGWRKKFPNEIYTELLEEIQILNSQFPVHRFFSLLMRRHIAHKESSGLDVEKTDDSSHSLTACDQKKRKQEQEEQTFERKSKRHKTNKELNGIIVSVDKSDNKNRLSKTKRRQLQTAFCAVVTEPIKNEAPHPLQDSWLCCLQGEDVLWTDKYQPQQSSEIIGNSASVKKLHSWLKEWKIKADIEERRRQQEERRIKEENSNESWDIGDFVGDIVTLDHEQELCNTVLIIGPSGVGKTAAVYACAQELGFKVFEVNSSALRCGRLILSQLKEATQSHQVNLQGVNTSKPELIKQEKVELALHSSAITSCEKVHRKVISSKKASSSCRAACNSSKPQPVKLTHFFKMSSKKSVGKTSDDADFGTKENAVVLKLDTLQRSESGFTDIGHKRTEPCKDPPTAGQCRKIPMSLLLFEEVDVIFPEDVGFLAAIKTFMSTSKRPIILTTNDTLFGGRFKGHFDEIHFKTPSLQAMRSYLQCLCVVENMRADPEDVSSLLCQNKGDIRQSILQLQLWVCSGGGNTDQEILKSALKYESWAELENSRFLEVLSERMEGGLFYSNIQSLFFYPFSFQTSSQQSINPKPQKETPVKQMTLQNLLSQSDTLSRSRKEKHLASCEVKSITHPGLDLSLFLLKRLKPREIQPKQNVTEDLFEQEKSLMLVFQYMVCTAKFFDNMSFLDAYLQRPSFRQTTGLCKPEPLGWIGAELKDSLLDLPREEHNRHCGLENSSQICAMIEGLGFHQCRAGVLEIWTEAMRLRERTKSERWEQIICDISLPSHKNIFKICSCSLCEPSEVQRRKELLSKLLSSKEFCCHGNKRALSMDYLPALRSICRLERVKEQSTCRRSHYLSRLHLPSSTLTCMPLDFP